MSRPRRPQTSADVDAEIRRLLEAKERLVATEDQRRGELLREYLARPSGEALRDALALFTAERDAYLFGLESTPELRNGTTKGGTHHRQPSSAAAPV
jgi:hypothetical protein